MIPIAYDELRSVGVVDMPNTYRLLWGEDIAHEIPDPPMVDYAYRGMHSAYMRMALTRRAKDYRLCHSAFPTRTRNMAGYAWRTLPGANGPETSIKEIVVLSGMDGDSPRRLESVTLRAALKQECPRLFREAFGGGGSRRT